MKINQAYIVGALYFLVVVTVAVSAVDMDFYSHVNFSCMLKK